MKNLVIFALTMVVTFSARAEQQCIDLFVLPPQSFAENFIRLTENNELLGQTSQPVRDANLIVEGGGLCASTCAVNVLHTIYNYFKLDADFSPMSRMGMLLESVRGFGVDGRMGIKLIDLKSAIEEQARYEWRFQMALDLISGRWVTEDSLAIRKQTLNILEVRLAGGTHAMVVLRIDPKTKQIDLGDPNYPEHVTRTLYTLVKDANGVKRMRIEMDEPWATSGLIENLLTIKAYESLL